MGILLTVSLMWNLLLVFDIWQKKRDLAACEACCDACENCNKGRGGAVDGLTEKPTENHK